MTMSAWVYFPLVENGPVVLDVSAEGGSVQTLKGYVRIPTFRSFA